MNKISDLLKAQQANQRKRKLEEVENERRKKQEIEENERRKKLEIEESVAAYADFEDSEIPEDPPVASPSKRQRPNFMSQRRETANAKEEEEQKNERRTVEFDNKTSDQDTEGVAPMDDDSEASGKHEGSNGIVPMEDEQETELSEEDKHFLALIEANKKKKDEPEAKKKEQVSPTKNETPKTPRRSPRKHENSSPDKKAESTREKASATPAKQKPIMVDEDGDTDMTKTANSEDDGGYDALLAAEQSARLRRRKEPAVEDALSKPSPVKKSWEDTRRTTSGKDKPAAKKELQFESPAGVVPTASGLAVRKSDTDGKRSTKDADWAVNVETMAKRPLSPAKQKPTEPIKSQQKPKEPEKTKEFAEPAKPQQKPEKAKESAEPRNPRVALVKQEAIADSNEKAQRTAPAKSPLRSSTPPVAAGTPVAAAQRPLPVEITTNNDLKELQKQYSEVVAFLSSVAEHQRSEVAMKPNPLQNLKPGIVFIHKAIEEAKKAAPGDIERIQEYLKAHPELHANVQTVQFVEKLIGQVRAANQTTLPNALHGVLGLISMSAESLTMGSRALLQSVAIRQAQQSQAKDTNGN